MSARGWGRWGLATGRLRLLGVSPGPRSRRHTGRGAAPWLGLLAALLVAPACSDSPTGSADARSADAPVVDAPVADASPDVRGMDGPVDAAAAGDGPAVDIPAAESGSCTCSMGCAATERCLQSRSGGMSPGGELVCDPPVGLAVCRPTCTDDSGCPTAHPHCAAVKLTAGCCSDATETVHLCCASADATGPNDCL